MITTSDRYVAGNLHPLTGCDQRPGRRCAVVASPTDPLRGLSRDGRQSSPARSHAFARCTSPDRQPRANRGGRAGRICRGGASLPSALPAGRGASVMAGTYNRATVMCVCVSSCFEDGPL